jgi:hypothetical protein
MKPLTQRNEIVDWFVQNQCGEVDSLFIPHNQCNAFMGTVVGQTNPSIAVLDYDIVIGNLVIEGMSLNGAKEFVLEKAKKKAPYGPILCHRFPSIHPNNFNKA